MDNFTETFDFTSEFTIKIKRIADVSYFKSFKLIPIQNSAYFYVRNQLDKDPFILPKLYVGLVHLTGSSDNRYDDHKGSYSFGFELEVHKNSKISKYYYHIYHYRSYIEFLTYELTSQGDVRNSNHYHQPNDQLFSDKDICAFSSVFSGYVLGYLKGTQFVPKPFIKSSNSNLLLFGYFKNKYFCEDYEEEDLYYQQKELLQKELATIPLVE